MNDHLKDRMQSKKELLSFALQQLARQCERFATELAVADKPVENYNYGDGYVLSRVGSLLRAIVDLSNLMDSMIPEEPKKRQTAADILRGRGGSMYVKDDCGEEQP
jgi:hypothetical protein